MASLAFLGQVTKRTSVKWPIPFAWFHKQTNKIKLLDYYLCFELSMLMLHIQREVMDKSIKIHLKIASTVLCYMLKLLRYSRLMAYLVIAGKQKRARRLILTLVVSCTFLKGTALEPS